MLKIRAKTRTKLEQRRGRSGVQDEFLEEAGRGIISVVVAAPLDLVPLARVRLEDAGRESGGGVAVDDTPAHRVGALARGSPEHGHDPCGRQGIARSGGSVIKINDLRT